MSSSSRKVVLIGIPVMLAGAFALAVAGSPANRRIWVLCLIAATTVLTCSSVAGYFFLKLFLGQTVKFRATLRGRGITLILAALAFGISFGSAALLSYLLSRT
jgi:hypothetical protein